jgi:hypothetical protein
MLFEVKMMSKEVIKRQEAIRLLATIDLPRLQLEERKEQLVIMTLENWSTHPRWKQFHVLSVTNLKSLVLKFRTRARSDTILY